MLPVFRCQLDKMFHLCSHMEYVLFRVQIRYFISQAPDPMFRGIRFLTQNIVGFTMSMAIFSLIFRGKIANYTFFTALISTESKNQYEK